MRIVIALFYSFRMEEESDLERMLNAVRVSIVSLHSMRMR